MAFAADAVGASKLHRVAPFITIIHLPYRSSISFANSSPAQRPLKTSKRRQLVDDLANEALMDKHRFNDSDFILLS
jgi:hypothetical protein